MSVKQCSQCGKAFECRNESRGCWCESLTIPEQTLMQLREDYSNCLCRECLAEYEAETSEPHR